MFSVPHPIPYQGSKRKLAPTILQFFPRDVDRVIEPFAGSAAVTLAAASRKIGRAYVLGDSLAPLAGLWEGIVTRPGEVADKYQRIWRGQVTSQRPTYFDRVRSEFNEDRDPVKLLYLIARCVKNAIRFNPSGEFNQSADHRRRGMHPDKMAENVRGASALLSGRTSVHHADYRELLQQATPRDLIYMDPPYQGVSSGRDARYFQGLDLAEFILTLERLNAACSRFLISFDGSCGDRQYGIELPKHLNLSRITIRVGRSSQATLVGRDEHTVESLYLSSTLAATIRCLPSTHIDLVRATMQAEMEI